MVIVMKFSYITNKKTCTSEQITNITHIFTVKASHVYNEPMSIFVHFQVKNIYYAFQNVLFSFFCSVWVYALLFIFEETTQPNVYTTAHNNCQNFLKSKYTRALTLSSSFSHTNTHSHSHTLTRTKNSSERL